MKKETYKCGHPIQSDTRSLYLKWAQTDRDCPACEAAATKRLKEIGLCALKGTEEQVKRAEEIRLEILRGLIVVIDCLPGRRTYISDLGKIESATFWIDRRDLGVYFFIKNDERVK